MATHSSVHQPLLEVLSAWLGLLQIAPTLRRYPVHQPLLQVGVVLLLDLLLHLLAETIAGTSVCHGGLLLWDLAALKTTNITQRVNDIMAWKIEGVCQFAIF